MLELNIDECKLLLKMIKSNQFYGNDVELVYDMVVKIQNIYKTFNNEIH